jgi:UDP-N-acetylglucosamine 2-epimerase (non-hydrolysing)
MKNMSTVKAARAAGDEVVVYFTHQHFDYNMVDTFFNEMGYKPDYVFGNGEKPYKMGEVIDDLMSVMRDELPDIALANGDTAAALVCGIAAMYTDTKFAHVEAGLRSFDTEMYEERNRIMVDSIAQFLFPYTRYQAEFLEGRPELRALKTGGVHVAGNTTVDLIEDFKDKIKMPAVAGKGFGLMTLHRKELTDRIDAFRAVLGDINRFSADANLQILWPLHPRSKDVLERNNVNLDADYPNITIVEPMDAFTFLSHEKYAKILITDSGCNQEEACYFGTPCVTVRLNTERPETLEIGANVLSGFTNVYDSAMTMLKSDNDWKQPYGQYGVGKRIVETIREKLNEGFDYA